MNCRTVKVSGIDFPVSFTRRSKTSLESTSKNRTPSGFAYATAPQLALGIHDAHLSICSSEVVASSSQPVKNALFSPTRSGITGMPRFTIIIARCLNGETIGALGAVATSVVAGVTAADFSRIVRTASLCSSPPSSAVSSQTRVRVFVLFWQAHFTKEAPQAWQLDGEIRNEGAQPHRCHNDPGKDPVTGQAPCRRFNIWHGHSMYQAMSRSFCFSADSTGEISRKIRSFSDFRPTLGIIFGSVALDIPGLASTISSFGFPVFGCSTAGRYL